MRGAEWLIRRAGREVSTNRIAGRPGQANKDAGEHLGDRETPPDRPASVVRSRVRNQTGPSERAP